MARLRFFLRLTRWLFQWRSSSKISPKYLTCLFNFIFCPLILRFRRLVIFLLVKTYLHESIYLQVLGRCKYFIKLLYGMILKKEICIICQMMHSIELDCTVKIIYENYKQMGTWCRTLWNNIMNQVLVGFLWIVV